MDAERMKMIRVFVDESGNMGSLGDYFVLAALVCTTEDAYNQVRRLVRRMDGDGR